jgi:hypothetical protein
MTPERWEKIKETFESALETAPEDRPTLVERASRGDAALRDEVMRLFAEFETGESAIRRRLEAEHSRRFRSAAEVAGWFEQGKWRLLRLNWSRRRWAQVMAGSAPQDPPHQLRRHCEEVRAILPVLTIRPTSCT